MNTPRLLDLADGGAITLLHGSRSPGLLRLSAAGSRPRNPFGPAVYLTTDPVVATCYTGREGAVYRVRVGVVRKTNWTPVREGPGALG